MPNSREEAEEAEAERRAEHRAEEVEKPDRQGRDPDWHHPRGPYEPKGDW